MKNIETKGKAGLIRRGDKYALEGGYYNANGFAVAIIASITREIDWAVYIGATLGDKRERETVQAVLEFGCKLSEKDAKHYFPEIGLPYRH